MRQAETAAPIMLCIASFTGLVHRPGWEFASAFAISMAVASFCIWVDRERKSNHDKVKEEVRQIKIQMDNVTMALGIRKLS
jgi:hypothetical protein